MYLWYHDGCMCQCRSTTSSSHVLELHDLRAKRSVEASAAAPHARRPSRRPSLAEAAADPDAIAVLDAIRFDSDDDDDEDEEGAGTNADDLADGDVGDESASGSHRASNTSAGTAVLAAGGGSGGNDRDSSRGGASLRPAEKEAKRRGRRAVWCWKFGRYYTSIVVVCSFVVSVSGSHPVTLWVATSMSPLLVGVLLQIYNTVVREALVVFTTYPEPIEGRWYLLRDFRYTTDSSRCVAPMGWRPPILLSPATLTHIYGPKSGSRLLRLPPVSC